MTINNASKLFNDLLERAYKNGNLALSYHNNSDINNAIEYYKIAMANLESYNKSCFKNVESVYIMVKLKCGLASVHMLNNDLEKAREVFLSSEEGIDFLKTSPYDVSKYQKMIQYNLKLIEEDTAAQALADLSLLSLNNETSEEDVEMASSGEESQDLDIQFI